MVTLDACPVERWAVKTSNFGPRGGRNHNGTDIGSPNPATIPIHGARIFAPFDGLVATGYEANGAGNWVWVTRSDGLMFKCFHLSSHAVRSGFVRAGEVVGYVGNTGASQGAHYHIELWENGRPFDPWPAISASLQTPTPVPVPAPPAEPEDEIDMATGDEIMARLDAMEKRLGTWEQDTREWTKSFTEDVTAHVLDQLDPRRAEGVPATPIRDLVEQIHNATGATD